MGLPTTAIESRLLEWIAGSTEDEIELPSGDELGPIATDVGVEAAVRGASSPIVSAMIG